MNKSWVILFCCVLSTFRSSNAAVKFTFGQWKGVELQGSALESHSQLPTKSCRISLETLMTWHRFSPMFWIKMLQWERRVLVKNRRKQIQPCQRWRFIFHNCISFLNVYPGNPVEEWLWFKHCRRKGIHYRPPERSRSSLYRRVRVLNLMNELVILIFNLSLLVTHISIKFAHNRPVISELVLLWWCFVLMRMIAWKSVACQCAMMISSVQELLLSAFNFPLKQE